MTQLCFLGLQRSNSTDHGQILPMARGLGTAAIESAAASLRDSSVSNSRYVLLLRTSDIAGAEAGIEIEGTSESLRRCRNACRARNYARTSIQNAS